MLWGFNVNILGQGCHIWIFTREAMSLSASFRGRTEPHRTPQENAQFTLALPKRTGANDMVLLKILSGYCCNKPTSEVGRLNFDRDLRPANFNRLKLNINGQILRGGNSNTNASLRKVVFCNDRFHRIAIDLETQFISFTYSSIGIRFLANSDRY
jgi:hypothetical protein